MGVAKGHGAGFSQDMSPVVPVSLSSLSIRSIHGMFCLWGCLATVLPLRAADPHPPEPLNNGSATRNWPLVKQGVGSATIMLPASLPMAGI